MALDNFIVRIYRRDPPDHLVGQVEDIELGHKQPFQSMEKLWRILAESKSGPQLNRTTVLKSNPDGREE